MARIREYELDRDLEVNDKVLGTDGSGFGTMNFSIEQLGEFLASRGLADPSSLDFQFRFVQRVDGEISEGGISYDSFVPIELTSVYISGTDLKGIDTEPFAAVLVGTVVEINDTQASQGTDYGFYEVSDAVAIQGGFELNVTLLEAVVDLIESTPSVPQTEFINISVIGLAGLRGGQGIPGPTGEPGPMGDQGIPGPEGQPGDQGQRGADGAPGVQGNPGERGDSITEVVSEPSGDDTQVYVGTGDTPVQGTPGSLSGGIGNFIVHQGPQGVTGAAGPTGVGTQGEQGDQGLSRLELYHQGTAAAPTGVEINTDDFSFVASTLGTFVTDYGTITTDPYVTFVLINPAEFADTNDGTTYTIPDDSWATPYQASAQGATGPHGPPGPAGLQGIQGEQGIGVQAIEDLDGNGTATVVYFNPVTGTTQTSNLPLPRGIQGIEGAQGPRGDTGATGAAGSAGAEGTQGPRGLQGAQGIQGNIGEQGFQGAFDIAVFRRSATVPLPVAPTTYNTATHDLTIPTDWFATPPPGEEDLYEVIAYINPATDDNNDDIVVATWGAVLPATGTTGPSGPRGLTGPQGDTGDTGNSISATVLTTGDETTDTVVRLSETNAAGGVVATTDFIAPHGERGPDGATGATGAQGVQGAQGQRGAQGVPGAQGNPGATGGQGDEGPRGPQGFVGDSITVGTVTSGVQPGDVSTVVLEERNHLDQLVDSQTVTIQPGRDGQGEAEAIDGGFIPVTRIIENPNDVDLSGFTSSAFDGISDGGNTTSPGDIGLRSSDPSNGPLASHGDAWSTVNRLISGTQIPTPAIFVGDITGMEVLILGENDSWGIFLVTSAQDDVELISLESNGVIPSGPVTAYRTAAGVLSGMIGDKEFITSSISEVNGIPTTSATIPSNSNDGTLATTEFVQNHTTPGGAGSTNLGIANRDEDSLDITSSTGSDVRVPAATQLLSGLLEGSDKTKVDAITNTGSGIIISGAERTKLDAITNTGSGIIISGDERTKLTGIATGAEVNVQSDWDVTDTSADDYIENKPTALSEFTNDAGLITASDTDTRYVSGNTYSPGDIVFVPEADDHIRFFRLNGTADYTSSAAATAAALLGDSRWDSFGNTNDQSFTLLSAGDIGSKSAVSAFRGGDAVLLGLGGSSTYISLPVATTTLAGTLTGADKTKLDSITITDTTIADASSEIPTSNAVFDYIQGLGLVTDSTLPSFNFNDTTSSGTTIGVDFTTTTVSGDSTITAVIDGEDLAEANPTATATQVLSTVTLNGVTYRFAGATPSGGGSTTDNLFTLVLVQDDAPTTFDLDDYTDTGVVAHHQQNVSFDFDDSQPSAIQWACFAFPTDLLSTGAPIVHLGAAFQLDPNDLFALTNSDTNHAYRAFTFELREDINIEIDV